MKLACIMVFAAISVAACSRGSAHPQIRAKLTPQEFVAVMVELARAPVDQRAATLQRHRTSDQELRAFVTAYAVDPLTLSLAFDSIQAKLDQGGFHSEPPPIAPSR